MTSNTDERHLAAGQQSADASPELTELAKRMYADHTRSHPTRHASRFPAWENIGAGGRAKWLNRARLATPLPPKPAGAVPLPEPAFIRYGLGSGDDVYYSADQIRKYGDAREAAAKVWTGCTTCENWRSAAIEKGEKLATANVRIEELEAAGRADEVSMAQRFLRWVLPVTFAPDAGISFDRSYCEKWATWPTGTNLFTADEAADMMRFVLETSPAGAPPAQQPLDDSANNAGVATGSRNESPSESVTRGSPQVTTEPAPAPQPITTPLGNSFVEDLRGEGAGRADAVPAWFGELPAPISNPEAWPANYAGGYNDALNMCYDVIRGHSPQPMTTQGEAVATVCLIGERYAHGTMIEVQLQIVPGTELPIGTKLYTGSQP